MARQPEERDGGVPVAPTLSARLPEFWRENADWLEPWLSALEGGLGETAGRIEAAREAWSGDRAREAVASWLPGPAPGTPRDAGTLGSLRRWLERRGVREVFPRQRRIFCGLRAAEVQRGLILISKAHRASAVVVWDAADRAARGTAAVPKALVPLTTRVQVILPASEEHPEALRPGLRVDGELIWDSETARRIEDASSGSSG